MILCATDFSEAARAALAVAAQWARRARLPLFLLHAVPPQVGDRIVGESHDSLQRDALAALEQEAARLRGRDLVVEWDVLTAFPDEAIVRLARERQARLIVLGAVGQRREVHWLLGSTTERVAATTSVPLLVVRDARPIEDWLQGQGTLKMLIATDLSEVSDAAIPWLNNLAGLGRVDATLAYVANEALEYARFDLGRPLNRSALHPIAEAALHRELEERRHRIELEGELDTTVTLTLGRPSSEIARLASVLDSELVVVGSHQRGRLSRMWYGSVANGVIHEARTNVVCVPVHTADEPFRALEAPEVRTMLAATDFSPAGNRAVAWAMALAKSKTKVIIVHVADDRDARKTASEELAKLERPASWPKDVELVIEIADGENAAQTICAVAERNGANLILVGRHGRGLASYVMGSVANSVLRTSRKPVIVVPQDV
jgi:nucleotide-binding universal stress UspA family protein